MSPLSLDIQPRVAILEAGLVAYFTFELFSSKQPYGQCMKIFAAYSPGSEPTVARWRRLADQRQIILLLASGKRIYETLEFPNQFHLHCALDQAVALNASTPSTDPEQALQQFNTPDTHQQLLRNEAFQWPDWQGKVPGDPEREVMAEAFATGD